jgi:hypothetical protein
MRAASLALLFGFAAAACGGGGGGDESAPQQALSFFKNCLYEWSLPGVPSSGSPVYRCYLTTACKATDVCDAYPESLRSQCPYIASTCDRCPAGMPLSQC